MNKANVGNIKKITKNSVDGLTSLIGKDIVKMILFGSYARGDYNAQSDIDIAVLTESSINYLEETASVAADVSYENGEIINFICIPYERFESIKEWYPFYKNINNEGVTLYERT